MVGGTDGKQPHSLANRRACVSFVCFGLDVHTVFLRRGTKLYRVISKGLHIATNNIRGGVFSFCVESVKY